MRFLFFLGLILFFFQANAQESDFVNRNPKFKIWFNTYLRQARGEVSESCHYPELRVYTNLKEALSKPDSVFILKLNHQKLSNVPNVIVKFKNLQYLDLSDNNISEIPAFIGELKSLRFFYADNNSLTKISNSINKCHFLVELSFSANRLKNLTLFNTELKDLKYLDLHNNQINNIQSFIKVTSVLYYMDVRNNPVKDSEHFKILPSEFHYLTNMFQNAFPLKQEKLSEIQERQGQSYELAFKQMIADINSQKSKTDLKTSENRILLLKVGELREIIKLNENKLNEQKKQISDLEKSYFYKLAKTLSTYLFLILAIVILIVLFIYTGRLYVMTLKQKKILETQKEIYYSQNIELKNQHDELQYQKNLLTEQHDKLQEQNTVLVEQQTQIQEQQLTIIEANKKAFIANLVIGLNHDLATPVSNISLSEETLNALTNRIQKLSQNKSYDGLEKITGLMSKSNEIIKEEIQKIKDWVNGFKQISSDQFKDEMQTIDLKNYIETFAKSILFKLEKNNIHLSVVEDTNICLSVQPGFISQIMQNLIENSIEHGFKQHSSKNKTITINLKKAEGFVIINFSDNGNGISDDIINNIFDPYFSTSNYINKGFGLFNVRNIIEKGLKGKINHFSEVGKGTSFEIIIPNIK